ncbi:hypothetical protein [Streptomyces sp. 4N124]|uniref:hypothetical protein n=1 Tax=Streptomyces sp. 4N124 TaxID=3457420 RepID=UPI003FD1CF63
MNYEMTCGDCGARPARYMTFTRFRCIGFTFYRDTVAATLCRTCGIAEFREAAATTLLGMWWSVWSPLVAPVVLLYIVLRYWRLRLFTRAPQGGERRSSAYGRPLLTRVPLMLLVCAWGVAYSSAMFGWPISDFWFQAR